MTSRDLKILEAAFEDARQREGEDRDQFLSQFGLDQPGLVDELRALLSADENAANTVADLVDASVDALQNEGADIWNGQQIGAWTIADRLGEGGMGSVFLVERTDGAYRQQAALKLTTSQLLSDDALSRFRIERQILANLTHPNIATLIDGGTHEKRLPYLVMEYIKGDRIDVHCDAAALGIVQRLRLFIKVCDAVDYAHRNLVVHRDLKPSNIMVGANGEPKLLDFGIAKLLESGGFDTTILQTREDARAMTPQYASPEQVRGEKVTVGTDVYALGVLLYRLLSGRSPYGSGLTTSRQVESAILDQEPTRPSHSIDEAQGDDLSPTAQQISQQRGLTASELRSQLTGDLDNIVLKCLQKEPERRYASVRDLARDIERYLNHEPVLARGDDFVYRARKFVRRHVQGLAITTAVGTAAIALVIFYTTKLAAERDNAELSAKQSQQVASFLKTIFEGANPAAEPGKTITARMLLDNGMTRIEAIEEPAVKGALLRSMGTSYAQIGDQDQGKDLLERSVALFRRLGTGSELDLARSLTALADIDHQSFRLIDAMEYRAEAVSLVRSSQGDKSAQLPLFLSGLATVFSQMQRYDEAIALWQEALEVQRANGTFGDGLTSDILGDLAVSYDNAGNYEKAIDTGLEALALSEEKLGPLDPNTIVIINNLGLVSNRMGAYKRAVEYSMEAIRRGEQLWPPGHWRLSFFRMVQVSALRGSGEFETARTVLQRASADVAKYDGVGSVNAAIIPIVAGDHESALGNFAKARGHFAKGVRIAEAKFGESGELTIRHKMGLANALIQLDETAAADALLREAHTHREALRRANRLELDLLRAKIIAVDGAPAKAGELLAAALVDKQNDVGADSVALLPFLHASSQFHRAAGDRAIALEQAERAFAIAQQQFPAGQWQTALAQAELGRAQMAVGEIQAGRKSLASARDALGGVLPAGSPHIVRISQELESTDMR